ncbi:MAG TPA: NAD(P)-dependent oxidoreductase [Clostridia bacterium]|nr:NAD(P)-dependent oxidoreductase [Clostridia bacterium]
MKVGFVGVGEMGSGMAKNTSKSGFEVYAYDIDKDKMKDLEKDGVYSCNSVKELAEISDVVITMLPLSPVEHVLEDIVTGENGLIEVMKPGEIIMDGGNTSPEMAKFLSDKCEEKNIDFLDIPVSGGGIGAEKGELSAMVGGKKQTLDKVLPILKSFSRSINHFGKAGMGQTAKLVNNMMVNINLAGFAEAFMFAKKKGLDIGKLYNAVSGGASSSWVMKNFGKAILERNEEDPYSRAGYGPRGGMDRELAWAFNMGNPEDLPMSVSIAAHEMYKMARAAGYKEGCYEPLFEYYAELVGDTIIGECKE